MVSKTRVDTIFHTIFQRQGKIFIDPGYDGVYGKVKIFSQGEQKAACKQKTLF